MYFVNKILVQTVLTFGVFIRVSSGNSNNTSHSKKLLLTTERNIPTPPLIFPNATLSESDPPIVSYHHTMTLPNITSLCWPDVSKTLWSTMLHHDKKYTGKHYKRVVAKYKDLNQRFSDHLTQLIIIADEIRTLLLYNVTYEEIIEARDKANEQTSTTPMFKKENNISAEILNKCNCSRTNPISDANNISNMNTEVPQEDSFTKSITVPILLIVILILLSYIAFLYRKLHFTRYKDAQILVQDELMDP